MSELRISNLKRIDKRVIFPAGEQHSFLLKAINKLKLSWPTLACKIRVHQRTLNDWKREKYSLPYSILKKICRVTESRIPNNIEIKDSFWYIYKGGKVGGIAVYKKYGSIGGDPEYRKKKWYEWWERKGKYKTNAITTSKSIREPEYSEELAEFVGIMIGDGGITKKQVTVTLNCKTDKAYSVFVVNLINKLFKTKPSLSFRKNEAAVYLIVSRTRLVTFCKSIGLKIGNKLKQNLDVPRWVKKKKVFKIACLRGLMDTDGCIFNECHRINNKKYCYPRLSFVSRSKQLRSSVYNVLKELGLLPKMRNNRSVQLENRKNIAEYFSLIGTNNPKHKKRFRLFFGGVGSGYPK